MVFLLMLACRGFKREQTSGKHSNKNLTCNRLIKKVLSNDITWQNVFCTKAKRVICNEVLSFHETSI
jgi:hypothetical protein